MIYLSGCVRPEIGGPDFGVILTPAIGNLLPENTLHAFDTGAFSKPDAYNEVKYLRFLEKHQRSQHLCLFATAVDVVGDARATLAKAGVLKEIRNLGYRAALVAQNGLEDLEVPWEDFDCLFVGGTTDWKLSESAFALAREADLQGKWVHLGRCNSWRRLKAAAVSGYDSADGSGIAVAPSIVLPKVVKWLHTLRREPSMEVA